MLLDDIELTFVSALLNEDETAALQAIRSAGTPLSVIVDRVNDRLFDEIGDAAIELDGDTPTIIADYEQDVRRLTGHA